MKHLKESIIVSLLVVVFGLGFSRAENNIQNKIPNSLVGVNGSSGSVIKKLDGGSGTFIYYVLTCNHLIGQKNFVKLSEEVTEAELLERDEVQDFAILRVTSWENISPVHINLSKLELGEEVYSISKPMGMPIWFSKGVVSTLVVNNYFFGHTASGWRGSSGSPVYNNTGEQVGLYSRMLVDRNDLVIIQSFNLAVSVRSIYKRLGKVKFRKYFN